MTKEKPKNSPEKKSYVLLFSILIGLVAMVAPALSTWTWALLAFDSGSGVAGDAFGGFANPFVGILTAYVTYQAFRQQVVANRMQQDQIDNNKTAIEFQAIEDRFFTLLNLLKEAERYVNLSAYNFKDGSNFYGLRKYIEVIEGAVRLQNSRKGLSNMLLFTEEKNIDLRILTSGILFLGHEKLFRLFLKNTDFDKDQLQEIQFTIETSIGMEFKQRVYTEGVQDELIPFYNNLKFIKSFLIRNSHIIGIELENYKSIVSNSLTTDAVFILYYYELCFFETLEDSNVYFFNIQSRFNGDYEYANSRLFDFKTKRKGDILG